VFCRYQTQGFILKKENVGEASQLFCLYTRDFGLLKILAKGIRKLKSKLRGSFVLFSLVSVEFVQGKRHQVLTGALTLESFPRIKKDLIKLRLLFRLSRIFCFLVSSQEKDQNLWKLTEKTWLTLEKEELSFSESILFYYHFFWQLVFLLGYGPELCRCVLCRKKTAGQIFFAAQEGGLVCQECLRRKRLRTRKISENGLKLLRVVLNSPWPDLKKEKLLPELKGLYREQLVFLCSVFRGLSPKPKIPYT
jgi:DNA repair protein RecO (recombination protein O)